MPNPRILREIVSALRRLTRRAEEADAPVARDVLSMSAGAISSIERGAERAERPAGTAPAGRLPTRL